MNNPGEFLGSIIGSIIMVFIIASLFRYVFLIKLDKFVRNFLSCLIGAIIATYIFTVGGNAFDYYYYFAGIIVFIYFQFFEIKKRKKNSKNKKSDNQEKT